ncbi:SLC13 family permease, partial [Longimicrobium sp.]|uniref:SLC13 family permease n=1 Tax=Longimicrobium sp. TaxID=2029185 RepID=UPI002F94FB6D
MSEAAGRGSTLLQDPPGEFLWPADRPGEHLPPPPASPAPRRRLSRGAALQWGASALGLAAAIGVFLAPTPAGLTPAGQAACAVFLVCTTLWITDLVPIGVTGLLAVSLLTLTGAMEAGDIYASFGNSAVFFIIGVFMLAAATIHSGLSKRLALFFLRRFEQGPHALAAGIMLTAVFMTVWMPAQAT